MALKPETMRALELAEEYAVRVINELAQPEATMEMWKTLEIDEAIDILADICLCKEKDLCIKTMKKGHGPHVLQAAHSDQHTLYAAGALTTAPTGHYGR